MHEVQKNVCIYARAYVGVENTELLLILHFKYNSVDLLLVIIQEFNGRSLVFPTKT